MESVRFLKKVTILPACRERILLQLASYFYANRADFSAVTSIRLPSTHDLFCCPTFFVSEQSCAEAVFDRALPIPSPNPLNHTMIFGYDAKGNLTTITNALNKVTTITVNAVGQPLTIKDPLNNTTTLTYDLGDLVKVKDPLNRETQRILDAAGRLRNITNPLGQKTLYTPDALDRITQLTDSINGNTAFTYDANSNLLTVTDAKSQQTIYTYSNMNRTATRKDPLIHTETYAYDNNGNMTQLTDRKGQLTGYTYDALNRKTKTTFQDGTSTNYTYDAGNRITQVQEKDAGGTVTATITRTYDGLDRLTQEVTAQGTVNYVYDSASRRTSMTVAGQTAVTYTHDNANRLTQIQQGTPTVIIAYDDADRRTSVTYPNGNSIVYAYNAASELTSLTYKSGATVIGDLTYTYDAAGNRIKTGGSFARSGLPPALTTVSYNANNQQITFGTNTETYDLNGNLATVTDAGNTATYTWNARNQLASIASPGFSASFTYDSFGRRTGKTVQGTTTNFVYDGLNPVQEKAGATVTANLLTGLGIDEFFARTDGVGVRALLPDALGSTVALGDGTGTLQTQYTYEPFGYATQTGLASTNSFKYTGREDDGTGLQYYRARYYHPRLQRFISEDPIGFAGGDVNLYAYVRNVPLLSIDPLGLAPPSNMPQDFDVCFAIKQSQAWGLDRNSWAYNPWLDRVQRKGLWDFKWVNPAFRAAGNYVYGLTGRAYGLDSDTIQLGAAAANALDNGLKAVDPRALGDTGIGHQWVIQGIADYDNGYWKSRCTCGP
ncbi:MAG: hypothetical protein E8D46_01315 [Nitrospira sp.]|nr:MAG: hypothetical protein E8D46_01315 [Nitrospira sp.]